MQEQRRRWIGWMVVLAATAQPAVVCAEPSSLAEVQRWAEQAWSASAGREGEARARGAEAARGEVPGWLRGVEVGAAPGWEVTRSTIGPVADTTGSVGLVWEVGPSQGERARAAWSARGRAWSAEAAAARWSFVRAALRGAVEVWGLRAMARHLADDLEAFDAALAPVREAASRGQLTPLEAGEFEVARAQLATEVEEVQRAAQERLKRLEAEVGAEVGAWGEGALEVVEAGAWSARSNPWTAVAAALGADHPAVQGVAAQGEAQRAEASSLEAWPLELSTSVEAHETGGVVWLAGRVGLVVPLAPPEAPAARALRAEAEAQELEGARRLATLRREVLWEEASWEASRAQLLRREEALLAPLEARVERLERSWQAGQVEVQRVIWARRELHEARHQQLERSVGLEVSAAQAEVEQRLMQGGR